MQTLRTALVGTLALGVIGLSIAPGTVHAQAGSKTYEITITNINSGKQALSPPVIATHRAGLHAWQMGQVASKGLEMVAEEGMPDTLVGELKPIATDVAVGKGPLMPGESTTVTVMANDGDTLSAASMLGQTNDGFTGLDSVALKEGTIEAMAYDAGTEENTELKADVPGDPFGGHNHGTDTTPRGAIAMHGGITGKADVTSDFSWSGPVARYTIKMVGSSMNEMGAGSENTMASPMPSMPKTGSGDITAVWLASMAAVGLAIAGLALRRRSVARVRGR